LILFVTVVLNWLVASTTGYSLLGGDLFTIFFVIFLVLLAITLIRPLMRRVLWRVRNRLVVTYFLIGALPAFLMMIVFAGLFSALSGSTVAYLAQSELNRRIDRLQLDARQFAEDIQAGHRKPVAGAFPFQAVVRIGKRTIVPEGAIREIPAWSAPGFKGIVRNTASAYFLAAHAASGGAENAVEVFAFSEFDDEAVAELVPGMARVEVFRIRDFAGESMEDVGANAQNVRAVFDSARVEPFHVPIFNAFGGFQLPNVRALDSGESDEHAISVVTRPTLIVDRILSSTLGSLKTVVVIGLLSVVGAFVIVDLIAVASSVKLTRTLTRTIHDLYTGTKKIEAGDFSHRIPVRSKDQLSELASSFNAMTQRVEQLIAELKDKEKLEAELEIARQVQSQLFPKEVPKLQTLELSGVCRPARIVSGDYYDFIPLDQRLMVIVIGDIAGKGISAALLMASVQSSLHAQLTMGVNGGLSTATLVARLNRQLYENTPPEKYATFYCGLYDDQNGLLAYTNAGHLAPILLRRHEVIRLESNGMVVGMFPDLPYEQSVIQLQSGDLLTAYTDGITESENDRGEQFGEERLTDLLLRHRDRPLEEITRVITDSVRNWAADIDNQDDTTFVLARRL
jgi:sigma-B regulation protein RsbU (phosphoserine phosphatase)